MSLPVVPPRRTPLARLGRLALAILLTLAASPLLGQEPEAAPVADTVRALPSDTYGDAAVQALLELAMEARARGVVDLSSYQARMWERFYLGVDSRAFRRERGIIEEERAALIRWAASGERHVRWEGARRELPIMGLSSGRDDGVAEGLAEELGSRLPPPLTFDPGSDVIVFGGSDWALNPLADSAGFHYRFQSGDTLRITLPGVEAPLTLAEVRVEPRRTEFRLLAASMWFDVTTGALVRGVYRPARPFDLSVDGRGDGEGDVPRFLGSIRAEIRVVSVDHGLFDLRWWIPQRFLFEGEATVGRLARFPLTAEWTLSDVEVNLPVPAALLGEDLPEGWTRTERQVLRRSRGDSVPVIRVVPPAEELARGGGISAAAEEAERVRFSSGELRELEARLGALLPVPGLGRLEVLLPPGNELARFNRVEGLALGVGVRTILPGSREISGVMMVASEALTPTAELRLAGGAPNRRRDLRLYRRLQGASEWHDPKGLGASLGNLTNGEGPTPWFYALGGSAGLEQRRGTALLAGELFAERHAGAAVGTRAHLRRWLDAERGVPENIEAAEGFWTGVRGSIRAQAGADPTRLRGFSSARGEVATGESSYGRASLTLGLLIPLISGWDAAVEGSSGGHLGRLPVQREFFPGGAVGFRGGEVGDFAGDAYWMLRGELGRGFTGARAVLFADALAVRPSAAPAGWSGDPAVAVGAGASLLDGLVRLDLARVVRPEGGWRAFVYFDALF